MSLRLAALVVLASASTAASCDRCGGERDSGKRTPPLSDAQAGDARASPSSPVGSAARGDRDAALSDGGLGDAARVGDASAAALDAAVADAGPSACRLVYGPAEQPFRGPAAIAATATELQLVANEAGKPRVFTVPLGPLPPASTPTVVPQAPSSFVTTRWPPCEIAGPWAYCQATGGAVYRTTLGGSDTKLVAKSQPGTRIAAAALGAEHAVVATLEARRTTEGVVMQAFVTLDEGQSVRLSEDGAGATNVRFIPRGDRATAIYLDARTAMLPVHARPLAMRGTELSLGSDAVVFIGGPPERATELAPAVVGRALFALVPMARETTDFGVAAISIAEQPKDDVQPSWSMYPNGLDPAPIAATTAWGDDSGQGAKAWVARVRPSERAASAPRILELGRLDAAGTFTSLGALSIGKRITDVAIATDARGAVWILYGDATGMWLERRVCS